MQCFLPDVSQRILVGAGVKFVAVDEVLVNELVEILVETAVVDGVGVSLVEGVLEREGVWVAVGGSDGLYEGALEARQVVVDRHR